MSMTVVTPGQARTRKRRQPNFPMAGRMKPFGLYPQMITPVLPGETLNEYEVKSRTISLPVRHPLFGAWLERWLVYVKITDIDPELSNMFLSTSYPTTGFTAAASEPRYFVKAGQIDWARHCMEAIWNGFFADESERGGTIPKIDGVPLRGRKHVDWTHNLMFTPAGVTAADLPSNPDGQLTGLQMMALAGMSELTYEKYLAQYNVAPKDLQSLKGLPEILNYWASWAVPTNTIDPSTGGPSSCWAWGDTVKAEKPRRFTEPGFLVLVSCVTPKMFSEAIDASRVGDMWGFADFFPSYNLDDPAAGIVEIDGDNPTFSTAFGGAAQKLLVDHRDLLTHGEVFVNHAWNDGPYYIPRITSQTLSGGAADEQTVRGKYPALADVNNLFMENTLGSPSETRRACYYEGIARADIAGHLKDTTL